MDTQNTFCAGPEPFPGCLEWPRPAICGCFLLWHVLVRSFESRCGLGVGGAKGLLGNKTCWKKKKELGLGRRAIRPRCRSDKASLVYWELQIEDCLCWGGLEGVNSWRLSANHTTYSWASSLSWRGLWALYIPVFIHTSTPLDIHSKSSGMPPRHMAFHTSQTDPWPQKWEKVWGWFLYPHVLLHVPQTFPPYDWQWESPFHS